MSKELSNLEEVAEDIFRVKLSTDLIQSTVSGFTLFGWCQTIGKPIKMVVSSDLLLFDCSKVGRLTLSSGEEEARVSVRIYSVT